MLNALRNRASGIVVKTLLLLLVGSFALWGIGDIFRSGSEQIVATVADEDISLQEYEQRVQQEIATYRSMLGGQVNQEMLEMLGVRQLTLDKMINQRLLAMETKELGLAVSDDRVIKTLRSSPAFIDENGAFQAEAFQYYLRQTGQSERQYLAGLKRDLARETLINSLMLIRKPPEILVEHLYQYRQEERKAEVLRFPADHPVEVPSPTETDLVGYYDQHAEQFTAPEYRTVTWVALDPARLVDESSISPEQARQYYETHQDQYLRAETRKVEQVVFPSKEAAQAAIAGENLEWIELGDVTREDLPEAAREQVFNLEKNKVGEPVETDFGWHVFRVTEIVPEIALPYDTVEGMIRKQLAMEQARDSLYDLSVRLEDALAGGATLEEAAEELGLKSHTAGPFSREQKRPDGGKIESLPAYPDFMETAFTTEEGSQSYLIETEQGAYYILRVDSLIPARTRALDEVRGLVTTAWQQAKKRELLQQMAENAAESVRGGLALDKVAARLNLTTEKLGPVQRTSPGSEGIPAALIPALFSLEKGGVTEPFATEAGGYVIAALTMVTLPPMEENTDALKEIREQIERNYSLEVLEQYMAYLRGKYEVTVNQELMQRVRL